MKIELALPFELGDTIWYPQMTQHSKDFPCTVCDATGNLYKADRSAVRCWNCHGYGASGHTIDEYLPESGVVSGVTVNADSDGIMVSSIEFETDDEYGRGWIYGDCWVSTDKDACAKQCESMNQNTIC